MQHRPGVMRKTFEHIRKQICKVFKAFCTTFFFFFKKITTLTLFILPLFKSKDVPGQSWGMKDEEMRAAKMDL